jgi:hypothetical protein
MGNRVLSRITGPMRGMNSRLENRELHNSYSPSNLMTMINPKKMSRRGHVETPVLH